MNRKKLRTFSFQINCKISTLLAAIFLITCCNCQRSQVREREREREREKPRKERRREQWLVTLTCTFVMGRRRRRRRRRRRSNISSFFLAVTETGEIDPKLLATVHVTPNLDASQHNTAASSEIAKSGKTTFFHAVEWTRSDASP